MTLLHTIFSTPLRAVWAGTLALAVPAFAAFPVTAALTAPVAAQSASARQADERQLDRVVAALRGITTLQADFTQTDRAGRAVGGKLTLKAPGRIRFEYDKSMNMLIVANGSALTLVDYDVRQVSRWPISNSPLGALLDPKRDVKRYGKVVPTGNPNVVSVEVKDQSKPEYGTITLIFTQSATSPGGLQLSSWVALDAQNQRTTVRLSNQRYGAAVADSTFTYRDPRVTSRRPR